MLLVLGCMQALSLSSGGQVLPRERPGVVQARNPSPTQGIEAAQLGKEVAHAEDALKKERASLLMVCWPRAEHWLAVLPAVLTRAPDLKVAAGPLTSASAPSQAQARCAAVQEQANSAKQELAATEERLAGARQELQATHARLAGSEQVGCLF